MLAKNIRRGLFLTWWLVLYMAKGFSQYTITGTAAVNGGQTYTYTVSPTLPAGYSWLVSGGTLNSSTSSTASVTWGCSTAGNIIAMVSGSPAAIKAVTITTSSALVNGSITPATQNINYGATASTLIGAVPTGGDCSATLTYQWYSSADGTTYSSISGATQANCAPGALTAAVTYYKRIATKGTQTLSTTAVVYVYPQLVVGTISPASQAINYNSSAATMTVSGSSGGSGTYGYQWQSSATSGGTYTNITSAVSPSYTPTGLTATTYYRVVVNSNGATGTAAASVTVYPQVAVSAITPAAATITYNTSPGTLSCTASGGTGTYSYTWYYSTDNNTYHVISGVNAASYTPGNLLNTTYYEVVVNSNGASATSSIATITVPHAFGVPAATHQTGSLNTDMNWQQVTSYDENGTILSDGKQFYDNTGRVIQNQVKVFYRVDANTEYTHVMASQPIVDAFGREVGGTLAAPIDYADFSYQPNFMQHNTSGTLYTHQNFDQYTNGTTNTDKTNNPDPLWDPASTSGPLQGSLAWYYSPSNNWEPYTPETSYPYSREAFYQDGTGNLKKAAAMGDPVRMGMGREGSHYYMPIGNELAEYIQIRNHFFSTSDLGAVPSTLQYQANMEVARDANGQEAVFIRDMGGSILMSARPGTDIAATNTVTLSALPYSLTIPVNPVSGCTVSDDYVTFYGNGTTFSLTHPNGTVTTMTGPLSGTGIDFAAADFGTVVQSDEPFSILYNNVPLVGCVLAPSQLSSQTGAAGAVKEYYFKILADNTSVTITGDYTLYDMSTETTTSLLTGNLLNHGFYKVVVNTGTVTLSYSNGFTNVAYNFFNQKGELVAAISALGVNQLRTNGISSYTASKTALPLTSLYTYNNRGSVISTQSPEGGVSQFIYRNDGKIRFSQNPIQVSTGGFSYTNYDAAGRPIESGQYTPDGGGITFGSAAMTNILESADVTGGLTTGTKKDVLQTTYDLPDNSPYNLGLTSYLQDATSLGGMVSVTRRYSTIVNNTPVNSNLVSATWFNYDEEGQLVWKVKYIAGLGSSISDVSSYKTINFTYSALGQPLQKIYQTGQTDAFTQIYDYDPVNKHLWHVSTSTATNTTPVLQATYLYYLDGTLKRVELGGTLQGIDYTYTLQGALKAINNSNKNQDPNADGNNNNFSPDAFGEVLDYYTGDYINNKNVPVIKGVDVSSIPGYSTPESYAGNVKAMSWYSKKPTSVLATNPNAEDPTAYVYTYDKDYQFQESTWGSGLNFANSPATFTASGINKEKLGNASTSTPAYDANGNILYLQRTDGGGTVIDQMSYQYSNNQLTSVTNTATSQPNISFTYDAMGNVTAENTGDANQKYMVYDVSGKVAAVYRDAAMTQLVVAFVYDEMGRRIKKLTYTSGVLTQVTFYIEGNVYTQAVTGGSSYGTVTPEEYPIVGASRIGMYYPQGPIYAYELTDHLGNVRAVVAQNSSTMEVRAYSDYYPYGMVLSQGGTNDDRYGYQGQYAEKDPETGWNAFELRMYDSHIARWLQYDPHHQHPSPYTAMGNDPVSMTDPDGGWDWFAHQNADGTIDLMNIEGDHAPAVNAVQADKDYVNIGESSLSREQALKNAQDYFDHNLYYGNFHTDFFMSMMQQEAFFYSNPGRYSDMSFNGATPWIEAALVEAAAGVKRYTDGTNNPRILEYLRSSLKGPDAQTQKTKWCACFINWTLNKAGVAGSGSGMAFSFKGYGQELTTSYSGPVDIHRIAYGSILVLGFSHVTYAIGINKDGRIVTLGGNQGDEPSGVNIHTVSPKSIQEVRYPAGFTPDFNLPFYDVHGPPLNFTNTHH